ncbi:uncharacterized protein LOC119742757 [Patiria miniata]|uniref:Uncharacterized protein n=1 Tax=Patiria miniata TaxID=46514 RepID=A0A914BF30_PATMI|nr:uncharacterized protein LOC119742757 [Patiria miniata]
MYGDHGIRGDVWASCKPPLNDLGNHSASLEPPTATWPVLWSHKGGPKVAALCKGVLILLLDASGITVTSTAKRSVVGLAHDHDSLFCIIESSSQVLQYNMANRQLVNILQCGNTMLARGVCLVSPPDDGIHVIDEEQAQDDEEVPNEDKAIQVLCILTVKDTLWIGTNTGKTLVLCLDSETQHSFGEVLAILGLLPEFDDKSGPVKKLLRAGDGHVVAMQELTGSSPPPLNQETRLNQYQLLLWQAWGSQEVAKFDHIHCALDEAELALGN